MKNDLKRPRFIKVGSPITPAVVDVGSNTKVKIVSHTFDVDDKLTPFSIRYVLRYMLKGSTSSSNCNLFDVDLSGVTSTKV